MRAARVHAWGAAPVVEELALARPCDGESLVCVEAASVGHLDRTIWRGDFPRAPELPYTPGVEGSGVVVQGSRFARGTRVWFRGGGLGTARDGSWCEQVAVPDAVLAELPAAVGFDAGATFFSPCTSAWVALHGVARVRPGERVLVTGGAGAVGAMVCQLALQAGAAVIAAVGHEDRIAHVVAGTDAIVLDRVAPRMLPGIEADVLIDTVGGETLMAALPSVVPGGRAVLVGYLGGTRLAIDLVQFVQRDVALLPLNMLRREAEGRAIAPALLERIGAGELRIESTAFALADAAAALAWLESPGHRGRAVLRPNA